MSPFLIFAIVLTIGYVIYYAVLISKDLYGKKDVESSNEEVFEFEETEEEATNVTENANGFSVDDREYETLVHHDEELPNQAEDNAKEQIRQEQSANDVVKDIQAKVYPKMENTDMFMEDQMLQDDMTTCLLTGGDRGLGKPEVPVIQINDAI